MHEHIMTILTGSVIERDGTLAELISKVREGKFIDATFRTNDGDFRETFYLPSEERMFKVVSRPALRTRAAAA